VRAVVALTTRQDLVYAGNIVDFLWLIAILPAFYDLNATWTNQSIGNLSRIVGACILKRTIGN
jgi:hypothetical protein